LAPQGTSIRRLLIKRRLAKCREAFEDPRQRDRSIGDIAYAFGFRDLSHFNHAFKKYARLIHAVTLRESGRTLDLRIWIS
jgi:AraC family transcriptional regulator, positive regulator of tynA and feaB